MLSHIKLLASLLIITAGVSGIGGFILGIQQSPANTVTGEPAADIVKYCVPAWTGDQPPWTVPFIGQWNGTYKVYVCRIG
jgi:hypothetical protein